MVSVIISGSRNPEGQTAQAVGAARKGMEAVGCDVETLFLPALDVERCRQCDNDGWGLCRKEGHCVIDDDFAATVEKIGEADAVIFSTPVYFSDLSESMRAFTDRLRRIRRHDVGRAVMEGKLAVGLCVAGGGGGGAPTCCVSLEKTLSTWGFDVVDVIPVRRQNLEAKLPRLRLAGAWLAGLATMCGSQQPITR